MQVLDRSVPPGLCLAYYKGTRPGLGGLQNRVGRYLDRGPYSHVEIVFSDRLSASSSWMDGGVRFKPIGYYSRGKWDFLPIPDPAGQIELRARAWFELHAGQLYDFWGNVRFASNFARDSADKWFCSEACMAALGYPESYRYGPSGSATVLSFHHHTRIIHIEAPRTCQTDAT